MRLTLIISENMFPIPQSIIIEEDHGFETVVTNQDIFHEKVYTISGEEEDINNWLKPFGFYWKGSFGFFRKVLL